MQRLGIGLEDVADVLKKDVVAFRVIVVGMRFRMSISLLAASLSTTTPVDYLIYAPIGRAKRS